MSPFRLGRLIAIVTILFASTWVSAATAAQVDGQGARSGRPPGFASNTRECDARAEDASSVALEPRAAPAPASLSYQGHLTDEAGTPLSGSHDLVFQLFDDESAGTQQGGDIVVNDVSVYGGVFTVELPVDSTLFAGSDLWLRLAVDGEWLAPRQRLLPAPYALTLRPGAAIAGNLEGAVVTVRNANMAGMAVEAAGAMLGVDSSGDTAVRAVGRSVGVEAEGMTGVLAAGDVGVSASGLVGVRGTSQVGHGVEGTSGAASGVYGESTGDHGVHGKSQLESGVFGETSGGFASGVEGRGPTGVFGMGGLVGVSGYSEFDDMVGVLGSTKGNNATGVHGLASGYGSEGVLGEATYGVGVAGVGETGLKGTGTVGAGVQGNGTYGLSGNGTTAGVMGTSTAGNAVRAEGGGGGPEAAALRVDNSNTGQGMAAYFTNASAYANMHLRNSGGGEVLILHSSGGRFLSAMDAGWDTKFRLDYNGSAYADGTWNAGGADFAEVVPAADGLQPGDVLVIGPDGRFVRSTDPYASTVAGVYSTAPGFLAASPANESVGASVPLALVGIVPVKASAENGPIVPGDLLVTAGVPGHAMRSGARPPHGTVIGKAVTGLVAGTGTIRMLVSLQ